MDKDISEAARRLSARRKTKRGGFNDPKIQQKIKQIKAEKREETKRQQPQKEG